MVPLFRSVGSAGLKREHGAEGINIAPAFCPTQ